MSKKTKKITSIGGSALIEGIMMRGPKKSTVCVRTGKDEIYSEDIRITNIPEKVKLFKVPFFRGIAGRQIRRQAYEGAYGLFDYPRGGACYRSVLLPAVGAF